MPLVSQRDTDIVVPTAQLDLSDKAADHDHCEAFAVNVFNRYGILSHLLLPLEFKQLVVGRCLLLPPLHSMCETQ